MLKTSQGGIKRLELTQERFRTVTRDAETGFNTKPTLTVELARQRVWLLRVGTY